MNYKLIDRVILFIYFKHNNWKWQFVIAMNHLRQAFAKYFSLSVLIFLACQEVYQCLVRIHFTFNELC